MKGRCKGHYLTLGKIKGNVGEGGGGWRRQEGGRKNQRFMNSYGNKKEISFHGTSATTPRSNEAQEILGRDLRRVFLKKRDSKGGKTHLTCFGSRAIRDAENFLGGGLPRRRSKGTRKKGKRG